MCDWRRQGQEPRPLICADYEARPKIHCHRTLRIDGSPEILSVR